MLNIIIHFLEIRAHCTLFYFPGTVLISTLTAKKFAERPNKGNFSKNSNKKGRDAP